jgi:hypothetical protein
MISRCGAFFGDSRTKPANRNWCPIHCYSVRTTNRRTRPGTGLASSTQKSLEEKPLRLQFFGPKPPSAVASWGSGEKRGSGNPLHRRMVFRAVDICGAVNRRRRGVSSTMRTEDNSIREKQIATDRRGRRDGHRPIRIGP